MASKNRDDGTAVWWFTAAAIVFTSTTVFFSDMPTGFRLPVMVLGAALLVGGILTYRRERPPRGPQR